MCNSVASESGLEFDFHLSYEMPRIDELKSKYGFDIIVLP